jgi:aspartyl-tRNA(Asn)/glutamyl-tRNA(Gln) amidotransferase subunit A
MLPTLADTAEALESGRTTSRALVEEALARIADPAGQGRNAFISCRPEEALAAAAEQDRLRKAGRAPSRLAGIPLAVKDLFDLAGEVTTAGSIVLKGEAPARRDADAILPLRAAGFVVMGRANMTEFAYSGVGINTHYGTPLSPYDRKTGRIPGGSSSGTAVAVADGMAIIGIGSDTGGSCRIPAAYNGITGYKPSVGRISTRGAFPLSSSFDSIGPLGASVQCCATADSLMAGDWDGVLLPVEPNCLTFGVLNTLALDGLDPEVGRAFEHSLSRLAKRGVRLVDVTFPELAELPELTQHGGIVAAEALATHRVRLDSDGASYDPRVRPRLEAARALPAADYINMLRRRDELARLFARRTAGLGGILLPTVMNVPPPVAALAEMPEYLRYNGMSLRNTYLGNFLNCCAISMPMTAPGEAPAGLMLMGPWGSDVALFSAASVIEANIAPI